MDVEHNPLLAEDAQPPEENRVLYLNSPKKNASQEFAQNEVCTTKYNVFTFLPKNLWEQFQRVANIYFLFISLLQIFVPDASPTGKYNTMLTLAFVLLVTAVKEAWEDYKRFMADIQQNSRQVKVLRRGVWKMMQWHEIQVGDIVQVNDKEEFPADLLLLSSNLPEGMCYIETANLDGETNLKIRNSPNATCEKLEVEALAAMKGKICCKPPNSNMYSFTGRMETDSQVIPLSLDNMLMRGCRLRNTQFINGLVIYTGHDTKIRLNSTATRFKQSSLEKCANTQILLIFIFEILLCVMGALEATVWRSANQKNAWYLHMEHQSGYSFESFITFFILVSNLIPISLYVTMEIMKVAISLMLEQDLQMYYEPTDTPAEARTTNLTEDLGQVEYIFSDKTGTLTQNVMAFKKCSIGGVSYSKDSTSDTFSCAELSENLKAEVEASKGGTPQGALEEFFRLLALCHTVIPDVDEDGKPFYQASSPDDLALVEAAKAMAFDFKARNSEYTEIDVFGTQEKYKVLSVLDFNSDRKRMSVVVQRPDGVVVLYTKGADSVIFPLLQAGVDFVDMTIEHLQEFAADGLRTLCVAKRHLEYSEWEQWNERFLAAKNELEDRERKTGEVMAELEVDLQLLGSTGIEDKLQDGVPETIATLLDANIKVWMLTGDKMETAINIGFSACLLTESMLPLLELASSKADVLHEVLDSALQKGQNEEDVERELAVVLDGCAMDVLFDHDDPTSEELRAKFVQVVSEAKAVVACRCSPMQKAEVVELIADAFDTITLGIGDGANDVSMLQAAHVGIGINGREGLQAVNSSDYAIAQFAFLRPLLLVHGRTAYRRLSKLMLYCFYKQVVFNIPLYMYSVSAGWSGQAAYEPWSMTAFNVVFTALPIMFFALLDRDLPPHALYAKPQLYSVGQTSYYFNSMVMSAWLLSGLWHSYVIIWVVQNMYAWSEVSHPKGHLNSSCYDLGVVIYTVVILVLTLKLMLETHYFTWINWAGFGSSIAVWFVWCFSVHLWYTLIPETNGTIYHLSATAGFWFCLLVTPVIALMRDFVWKFGKRVYCPEPYHLVQEAIAYDIPLECVDLDSSERKGALRRIMLAKAARAAAYTKSLMGFGYAYDGPSVEPRVQVHKPEKYTE